MGQKLPLRHRTCQPIRMSIYSKVRTPRLRLIVGASLSIILFLLIVSPSDAQYFGRNKPRYENFDFRVMETPHFEIHYYPPMETAAKDAARMAERWYSRLSKLFGHTFSIRRPLILYADQGDFQQTYTIGGEIGEGTGGFTEPIKDRIVLPLTGSYADNDHVIGHELVHAFQYDIAQKSFQQGEQRMAYLPLWFLEGMAEYLSLSRADANTAMWMRDVVIRNEIPTIDDVSSDMSFFPYRFGQAIWAWIAGRYGDDIVPKLFRAALRSSASGTLDDAFRIVLSSSEEKLSKEWGDALKESFGSAATSRTLPDSTGRSALGEDGEVMDVAPALSPDGAKMIFLSSRDFFSTDVYLADLRNGRLSKIVSEASNPHADALRYVNSAGSWSPDGRYFAFVVYESGNDRLAILDVAEEDIIKTISIPTVGAISNPSWSPDGKKIVFSGSVGGVSDLFIYDLSLEKAQRVTNDRHADLQPVYSPDGSTIAFVSDRGVATDFGLLSYAHPGISLLNVSTLAITQLDLFSGGKAINPMYSPDGKSLFVIADPDGYSDIYRIDLADRRVTRITKVATGVSGITAISPAMSVARNTGDLAFSVFTGGGYSVRILPAATPPVAINNSAGGLVSGRILPPQDGRNAVVNGYLGDSRTGLPSDSTTYPMREYTPTLKLDYVGIPYLGAAASADGVTLAAATAFYFSDYLEYNRLALGLSINGDLADVGGEIFYEYARYRWGWGVGAAHYPITQRGAQVRRVNVDTGGTVVTVDAVDRLTQRTYIDQVELVGKYPFSTTRRFEIGTGFTRYSFSGDINTQLVLPNGQVLADNTVDLDFGPGLNLLQSHIAYVGDNSYFGFTGPIKGERFRAELGGTVGSLRFMSLTLDYRRYFYLKPFTLAFRGFHYGRYGPDELSDRISPLFLGYEWNVRGYMQDSFNPAVECSGPGCPEFDRLLGSKIVLGGAELRLPIFGTANYGLINFPYLPTDFIAFADAGLAWHPGSNARLALDPESLDRVPVTSVGFAGRFNLFGYAVLEIFNALPFERPKSGWVWGISLQPGW